MLRTRFGTYYANCIVVRYAQYGDTDGGSAVFSDRPPESSLYTRTGGGRLYCIMRITYYRYGGVAWSHCPEVYGSWPAATEARRDRRSSRSRCRPCDSLLPRLRARCVTGWPLWTGSYRPPRWPGRHRRLRTPIGSSSNSSSWKRPRPYRTCSRRDITAMNAPHAKGRRRRLISALLRRQRVPTPNRTGV